jgi:hypothetical protein
MILASGYFDRDLSPHPGHPIQLRTEQEIHYRLTFLLTGFRKNVHRGR